MSKEGHIVKRITIYGVFAAVVLISAGVFISCLRADSEEYEVPGVLAGSMGPLTIGTTNPRYFADGTGKAIYLTGSHTWENLQDVKHPSSGPFHYATYLNFLKHNNHNFFRLWTWEQAAWLGSVPGKFLFSPLPYMRTGPGKALDGKPKFDLNRFNEAYFKRLRSRVLAARKKGIYVSVMLFNGFSIEIKEGGKGENPWKGHPFNEENNINGVNGDLQAQGSGRDIHTLSNPQITVLQETYVKKVVDTLSDLDNVLWEIANESHNGSTEWQYHMIDFLHNYEKGKGRIHPVLMTAQWPGGTNATLFGSPAEAISPLDENAYKTNPPATDGRKVIISDTDHLPDQGSFDYRWVWKTFLRGLNPVFMDPYNVAGSDMPKSAMNLIRKNMGYTLLFANRMNLVAMLPQSTLASSGYCLAESGKEYLAYTQNGAITLNLSDTLGTFNVEWLDPIKGTRKQGDAIQGGASRSFVPPFSGDAILYLYNNNLKRAAHAHEGEMQSFVRCLRNFLSARFGTKTSA
jgi:hypothetical protein